MMMKMMMMMMMMMAMMMIRRRIMIIIIFAFKGTIRDSSHCAANCLQLVRSSGPGAIVLKSPATVERLSSAKCRVYVVRRDNSAVKFDRA